MGLATFQRQRNKKGKIVAYVTIKDGRNLGTYLVKDYPYAHIARTKAMEHARRLNGGN